MSGAMAVKATARTVRGCHPDISPISATIAVSTHSIPTVIRPTGAWTRLRNTGRSRTEPRIPPIPKAVGNAEMIHAGEPSCAME